MFDASILRRAAVILLPALFLVACDSKQLASEESAAAETHRNIEAIADEYLAAMLERDPTMGTNYSIPGARHDRLYDNSLEALADWQAREDSWLAEINAIGEPADVGSRDWVTFGFLHEELASSQAIRICRKELWETSTTTAWYTEMPFVFDLQPLDTPDLKQQALARLGQVDRYIETEIQNLQKGLGLGYSSPRLTVEAVPGEVRALLDDNNPFLGMGKRAEDEEFAAAVQKIFDEEIVPAIDHFADFIEYEYVLNAREEIAISYNPDGAECYPALVRAFA